VQSVQKFGNFTSEQTDGQLTTSATRLTSENGRKTTDKAENQ
jgi:hypothetical protein